MIHVPKFGRSGSTPPDVLIRRSGSGHQILHDGGRLEIDVVEGVRRTGPGTAHCDVCNVDVASGRQNMRRHGQSVRHRENLLRLKRSTTNGDEK